MINSIYTCISKDVDIYIKSKNYQTEKSPISMLPNDLKHNINKNMYDIFINQFK